MARSFKHGASQRLRWCRHGRARRAQLRNAPWRICAMIDFREGVSGACFAAHGDAVMPSAQFI
jgi:hypothetical protein